MREGELTSYNKEDLVVYSDLMGGCGGAYALPSWKSPVRRQELMDCDHFQWSEGGLIRFEKLFLHGEGSRALKQVSRDLRNLHPWKCTTELD